MTHPTMSLAGFTGQGYDKGRGKLWQALWFGVGQPLVASHLCPSSMRVKLLRAFGARIGRGVFIRDRVRVHWPWKLSVGDNCWIGVGAWILNLEPVDIGPDSCLSQEALLCTGSHQRRSATFEFDNRPIHIGSRCWIATRAVVLRGVRIGDNALIAAGAVVSEDVPAGAVVRPAGNIVHNA